MAASPDLASLKRMSIAEKLRLIESLWSLIDEDSDIPIAPEVMAEMERRLKRARRKPDDGMTVDEFEARLRKRK